MANEAYPTTEVLKRMDERQYARHWKRICDEIRAADPTGDRIVNVLEREGQLGRYGCDND